MAANEIKYETVIPLFQCQSSHLQDPINKWCPECLGQQKSCAKAVQSFGTIYNF